MAFEINYKELSEAGLKDLLLQNDPKAHEEYKRRLATITKYSTSVEEFQKLWEEWKFKGAQLERTIDYTKLTVKQLRRLITLGVDEALNEYDRRIQTGEIKSQKVSLEEFIKNWEERKKAKERKAS